MEEQRHLFPQTNNVRQSVERRSGVTRLSPGARHQSPGCAHQRSQWGAVAPRWQMASARGRGWEQTGADFRAGPGGRRAREGVSKFIRMHLSEVNTVSRLVATRRLVSHGKFKKKLGNWSLNRWIDTYPCHSVTRRSILEETWELVWTQLGRTQPHQTVYLEREKL